ncbi:golgin subfamily A member 4-like [Olea europaea var. sylvestris]|uniref:golgin subfamily A member 4-like n=1 Tax=Olea europaea var. sylvestris TaxID=158386 RepID=UPI000C1D0554|nr:golgin subfamily A member 4-like [Olea europaea var. sylvestris]
MFKSARWRSEKNKVKVVFRLQFHATQLSQVGGDALMISVVPADVGKPSVKSEKAIVRDGVCLWDNPVYETVKLNQEPKSGKIHEKIYYFVVGTGTSKAGCVGEAMVDFSIYAEVTKVNVSLPLKNSKSEAKLHISIQRVQDSVDQREVEESEDTKLNSQDRSLRAQLSNGDMEGTVRNHSIEDVPLNETVPHMNGNRGASSGSDITMSSSESSSGLETPWEPLMKNSHHEPSRYPLSLNHYSGARQPKTDALKAMYDEHQTTQWECLGSSAFELSTDGTSSTPTETILREHSQEASAILIEKLKSELAALSRQVEISELELQTLRKQIVKENKRVHDLSREITSLKEERDVLKGECEKLKALPRSLDEAKNKTNLPFEGVDPLALAEELRQELNYAKDLNANLQIQLQKTQESNSELILAVRDLDEMLEQKNQEILALSSISGAIDTDEKLRKVNSNCQTDDDDDDEQKALEELVREHNDAKEAYLLEQQIIDLHSEIEIYKRDKDELEMQMEQLALDYEIMKQENHDMSYKLEQSQLQEQLKIQYECSSTYASACELEAHMESLENELKKRSEEFSDSLVTISELEAHIESLENELTKQSKAFSDSLVTISELEANTGNLENELKKRSKEFSDSLETIRELEAHSKSLEAELETRLAAFDADLEALALSKVEQEQRAIRAEETLRKTRWQNANTAERLQEEFRRLSVQMASTFEANEKLANKALAEANELRIRKSCLEEMLQETSEKHESVKEQYEATLQQLSNQVTSMIDQIKKMELEIEDKTMQLENQKKHAEETQWLLSEEIQMLKTEIETYVKEHKILLEEAGCKEILTEELEQMRKSVKELELLLEDGNSERIELENKVASVKKEAEEVQKQLNEMRCQANEKETIVGNLLSEINTLRAQYKELTCCQLEDELEKEKLRKQMLQLKSDLKKKEDALSSMEKKIKDSNGRATTLDGTKVTSKANKSMSPLRGSKEVANLKEKIKLLEGQIRLKETALERSTNSFLEKENDLHDKIEELQGRLEVLNQSSINFCENEIQKVAEEVINADGGSSMMTNLSSINSSLTISEKSDDHTISDELKAPSSNSRDLEESLSLISVLKEKNISMEGELKEMQERYSEISLKFAEVEGERQQLVMTLRNLKNAKKSS